VRLTRLNSKKSVDLSWNSKGQQNLDAVFEFRAIAAYKSIIYRGIATFTPSSERGPLQHLEGDQVCSCWCRWIQKYPFDCSSLRSEQVALTSFGPRALICLS
jgi:hypothetical protein